MAIVALSASPATLDSGGSDFVSVTNTGAVDVTVSRGSQSFTLRPNQSRTVYPEGAAVTAVSAGTGQVTTVAQAAQVTQSQQLAANTTAIAGLPGTYDRPRGNRFAILGDSIAGGVGVQPSGGQVDNTTGDQGSGSWFMVACLTSQGGMRYVYNAGIPGETTTQQIARISQITALAVDYCFIAPSINDIAQSLSQATTLANLTSMISTLKAANIQPILTSLCPNNNGPGTYHTASVKMNAAVQALATTAGVPFLDFYSLLVDPTTAGSYAAGMNESASPAVHPSRAGHLAMGQYAWSKLSSIVTPTPAYLVKTDTDPQNLAPHGCFAVGASGVPTGWAATGSSATATLALTADAGNVLGNWVVVSRATNDGTKGISTTILSGFNVGDTISLSGLLSFSGGGSGSAINTYVQFTGTSKFLYPMHSYGSDITRGQFYWETVVPPGTTNLVVVLLLANATGAGTATAKFGQVTVLNKTALGIAA